ncbi:DUF6461 domain-containing protein [Actinokineospora iranica]|uniref:Uncharacterized protein n=1 Tax=Actinokineospora iranica TaxID=1271860 RepID=A0A1G6JPT6_9PSEU|nr:DUF6461 domain-containing protein [Actinokineospora iranica]SDC20739.1 hypothetical protein SAMN05216174_101506 [Actinokineospora iranica]
MLDTATYQWINDERYSAITLAIVAGTAEDDVIRAYGGTPETSEIATFDESFNSFDDGQPFHVQTFTTGQFVVAVENNGFHGSDSRIARKVTGESGRFISVKWSSTGGDYILYVVGHKIEAQFDALSVSLGGDGDGIVPEWVNRVDWSQDETRAPYLALLGDVMGVHVSQEWFTTPHRTTVIPELYSMADL